MVCGEQSSIVTVDVPWTTPLRQTSPAYTLAGIAYSSRLLWSYTGLSRAAVAATDTRALQALTLSSSSAFCRNGSQRPTIRTVWSGRAKGYGPPQWLASTMTANASPPFGVRLNDEGPQRTWIATLGDQLDRRQSHAQLQLAK